MPTPTFNSPTHPVGGSDNDDEHTEASFINNNNNNNADDKNASSYISPSDVTSTIANENNGTAAAAAAVDSVSSNEPIPNSPTSPLQPRLLHHTESPSEIRTNLNYVHNTLDQFINSLADQEDAKKLLEYVQFIADRLLQSSRKRSRGINDNDDTAGDNDNEINTSQELQAITSFLQSVKLIQIALNNSKENIKYIQDEKNKLENDAANFGERVSNYKTEISRLHNIINDLRDELGSTGRADTVELSDGRLVTDFQATEEMVNELQHSVRALTISKSRVEGDNRDKQVEIDGIQSIVKNLNRTNLSLMRNESIMVQEVALTKKSRDHAQSQIANLMEQTDTLRADRKVESDERIAESTALCNRISELEESLKLVRANTQSKDTQLEIVNAALDSENGEVSALQLAQKRDRALLKSTQAEVTNLEEALDGERKKTATVEEDLRKVVAEHAKELAKQAERAAESAAKDKRISKENYNEQALAAEQALKRTADEIHEVHRVFKDGYVRECEVLNDMIDTHNSNRTQLEEERAELANERARVEKERIELANERTRLEEEAAAETKRTGSSDDAAPPIVPVSSMCL